MAAFRLRAACSLRGFCGACSAAFLECSRIVFAQAFRTERPWHKCSARISELCCARIKKAVVVFTSTEDLADGLVRAGFSLLKTSGMRSGVRAHDVIARETGVRTRIRLIENC